MGDSRMRFNQHSGIHRLMANRTQSKNTRPANSTKGLIASAIANEVWVVDMHGILQQQREKI